MIEFSRWIRKTHPNYFTESEDLNANPLANPQSPNPPDPHAVQSSIYTTMPTPKDFKSKASPVFQAVINSLVKAAKSQMPKLENSIANANNKEEKTLALRTLNSFVAFANEMEKRVITILNSQGLDMFYCAEMNKIIRKLPKNVFSDNKNLANEINAFQTQISNPDPNATSPIDSLMDIMTVDDALKEFTFTKLFEEFLDEYSTTGDNSIAEEKLQSYHYYIPPVNSSNVRNGLLGVKQAAQRYQEILEPFIQQGLIKIPKN
jgi:hypothetical protein